MEFEFSIVMLGPLALGAIGILAFIYRKPLTKHQGEMEENLKVPTIFSAAKQAPGGGLTGIGGIGMAILASFMIFQIGTGGFD